MNADKKFYNNKNKDAFPFLLLFTTLDRQLFNSYFCVFKITMVIVYHDKSQIFHGSPTVYDI